MRRSAAQKVGRLLVLLNRNAPNRNGAPRGFASAAAPLKRTVLYDFHVENGAKMVPFAGYSMPLLYKDSILNSTLNCRHNGSLFDVSHMCGLSLKGKDAIAFVETLVVGDIAGLGDGACTLSALTNERGGTVDDTVITKVNAAHVYLVVNAGCRDKDLAHIGAHLEAFKAKGKDVSSHVHDERSLLALQGPLAAPTLQRLVKAEEALQHLYFGNFKLIHVNGVQCFVTRTGYTGEDGFEISVASEHALELAKAILEASEGKVALTGLGARDSLRLEAGLCLYGSDMDEETSVVEAGLAWTVGKRRRGEGGFLGADVILKQLKEGVSRKRVGLVSEGAPARAHCPIHDAAGGVIGEVTSGGFSPCLNKNIAMGYVATGNHKDGTPLSVAVRGKLNPAVITKMPFVPAKYHKKP